MGQKEIGLAVAVVGTGVEHYLRASLTAGYIIPQAKKEIEKEQGKGNSIEKILKATHNHDNEALLTMLKGAGIK